MKKYFAVTCLFISSAIYLQGQNSDAETSWLGELKGGIRIQKTQKLYWENGFTVDFSSPKILDKRIHIGMSYVTSRLGSAIGSNAIKQDNYLLNLGFHFRHQKHLQPFARLNMGYFYADYESPIFDVLPNKSFLLSIDAGLSYAFKIPITFDLTAGYNFITGSGTKGPGTLYPIFYQMSIYYTLLKKN